MKVSAGLFLFVTVMSSVACTASTGRDAQEAVSIAVEALYSNTKCGHLKPEASVRWVNNDAQLARTYQLFQRDVIGAAPAMLPEIDFSRHRVVLVEMGRQPTLGYRLGLNQTLPGIVDGRLEIVLDWIEPAKNMMVGEMLTSPCLLLKVERGPYHQVWFKDQFGLKRVSLAVSR